MSHISQSVTGWRMSFKIQKVQIWNPAGLVSLRKHSYPNIQNFFSSKNRKFSDTKLWYIYFCSKHRCGSKEYPQSMFLGRKKNNVCPCKPQLYYMKVGLRGSMIPILYRHVFGMIPPSQKIEIFGNTCNIKMTKIGLYSICEWLTGVYSLITSAKIKWSPIIKWSKVNLGPLALDILVTFYPDAIRHIWFKIKSSAKSCNRNGMGAKLVFGQRHF